MRVHALKIDEGFIPDLKSGVKPFEIRKNDRDYQVGDYLIMDSEVFKVTYVLKEGYGLKKDYCAMAVSYVGSAEEVFQKLG